MAPQNRNALLLAGLLGNFAQQTSGGQNASPFGDLASLLLRSTLAEQANQRILDRQRQLMLAREGVDPNASLESFADVIRQRQQQAAQAQQQEQARTAMEQQQGQMEELLGQGRDFSEAQGILGLGMTPGMVTPIEPQSEPPSEIEDIIKRTREANFREDVPGSIPPGPETRTNLRGFEGSAVALPSAEEATARIETQEARQRLPTRRESITPLPEPTQGLPGGSEFLEQIQAVQDSVLKSQAFQDFQNSLTSLVEGRNLVQQAQQLQEQGETQGVGQNDKQLATLLARSLETGRLTDQDIARATGEVDRAVIDRIKGAFNKALNGAALLPGERQAVLTILESRVMERAAPILQNEIDLRLSPFEGLPPPLLERLRRSVDIGSFMDMATRGRGASGTPVGSSGNYIIEEIQ